MRKISFMISAVVLVLVSSLFFTNSAYAQPSLSDVQKDREELKSKLSKAEAEIADVLFEIEEQNKELADLQDTLVANEAVLTETEEAIENFEVEIAVLQTEVDLLQIGIEARTEILKNRISSYQKNGGNISYIEVFLGSKSFNEFINRVSAVNRVTSTDAELIEQQNRDKAVVEINQAKIQRNLTEKEDLLVELKGTKVLIEDQKLVVEEKIKDLNKKENEFKTKKSKLQSKDNNLANLESSIRNSMRTYTPNTPSAPAAKATAPIATGSGNKSTAINAGFNHIGTPYRWAGKAPGGFDCSGFVSWAYGQAGYSLPSSTDGLQSVGSKVSYSNAKPGDLVYFNTYKTNGHVGIYLGDGKFIGAQNSTGLAVADMNSGYWKNRFAGHVRRIN